MSRDVRSFYEKNTRLFLAFGGGKRAGAIHREVWGPGVTTRFGAFSYVNDLIGTRLNKYAKSSGHNSLRVIDLGCGVGGSLEYILRQLPAESDGVGITISQAQVNVARDRKAPEGRNLMFLKANYNALPQREGSFDAAYAIEAFVHGNRPARFFDEAARILEGRGRLYLIDDFLTKDLDNEWIERFRKGWLTGSLLTQEAVKAHAERAGLRCVEQLDLTPWLRLGRVRDRLLRRVMRIQKIRDSDRAYLRGLSGGDALQKCITEGWIVYQLLGFEKNVFSQRSD